MVILVADVNLDNKILNQSLELENLHIIFLTDECFSIEDIFYFNFIILKV